jgi:beta-lactamase regulating signal transducer with metallopeptidase domain
MSWESRIMELLSASLVRPLILVAAAFLVLRVFRVEHPASKHAVWTCVLAGMVLLPFASVVIPHVDVPALPQGMLPYIAPSSDASRSVVAVPQSAYTEPASPPTAPDEAGAVPEVISPLSLPPTSRPPAAQTVHGVSQSFSTRIILLWSYFAGVIFFALYRIAGWILLRRLLSRSRPLKLKPLRECNDVTVPVAVGIWRPAVVLPSNWRQWDAPTRRAILSHELAHIRRKDAWVLMLSRWAKCLFWFHPLAWWISRKTTELAEMACDAVAVRTAGDPASYARILLDFSNVVSHRGYRATLPGLAMVGQSPLSRRVDQLFAASTGKMRKMGMPGTVFALVGIPTLCAAATLGLTESVSRPLLQARRIVAAQLESAMPVLAQQPLPSIALSFLGLEAQPVAPQQPTLAPREFLERNCVTCHNARARVGNIALDQVDLTQIQRDADLWEKVVRKVRGGVQAMTLDRNSSRPDPTASRSFIEWLEAELDRAAPVAVRTPLPHRLNRTEYRNAIRDLLSLEIDPALLFPADDSGQGLDNLADVLQPVRPELYKAAAERISDLVMASPSRSRVFICRPASTAEDAACARRIIENLATHAFRRPATPEDMNALMPVFESGYRSNPIYTTFDRGIDAVLRNILVDRRFLYRTDVEPSNIAGGQTYRVDDMDLASRLSFFLWSTGPDDQLLDLARRGQLQDPTLLERETRRMLKDPRAEALTLNFAGQWLWLRALQRFEALPSNPDFDEPLRQAMRRETELFFSSIVQEDRNVLDLVTGNYTFLNERLARHYGIPGVTGTEFRRVTLSTAFDVRRGLLGKAAILTTTSHADRTSVTNRGKTVLYSFLGLNVPPPPPNVLPLPEKLNLPMRRVMDQANSYHPSCVSCHAIFDPVGIALDNFDLAGKWRTQENGQTIDPVTELNDGTKLAGPADVRNAILARSDLFTQQLTGKLLTYALGRRTSAQDMPLVRSIVRDAARDNNRFSAIVLRIVKSAPFQMNLKN